MVQVAVEPAADDGSVTLSWQPIETAPKDGSPFLVATPCDVTSNWEILRAEWNGDKIVDATYDPFRNQCDRATHWMPLPKPPRQCDR